MKKLVLSAAFAVLCLIAFTPRAASDVGTYLLTEKAMQVLMLKGVGGGGTGFELRTPSGNVVTVTNKHICALAENGYIAAYSPISPGRGIPLRVKGVSDSTDLCALEAVPGATGLSLAERLNALRKAFILGHPWLNPLTFSEGYMVVREAQQMSETLTIDGIETTIPAYPGNSGSPVFDSSGDVIGVVFATDQRTHWGVFIPLDVLKSFISAY